MTRVPAIAAACGLTGKWNLTKGIARHSGMTEEEARELLLIMCSGAVVQRRVSRTGAERWRLAPQDPEPEPEQ